MTPRTALDRRAASARWVVAVAVAGTIASTPDQAAAQAPGPQTGAERVLLRTLDEGPDGRLASDRGASGVWQRLQKLRTTGSVLYTTGHPDDEEAGMLTLLGRGEGARTALLTLNRGEAGANAIGPELFDALGLIRTEELRLAGRYYGLDDQYFTTAVDYGFSKTLDEAMRSWDRETVLGDMVRAIRINRPLVVASRWHGSERDGHGHHQAAGVLTPEAVRAAADPTRFPEQITREGLRPWAVRKLYRGRVQEGEAAHLEIDPSRSSPWLGTTYEAYGSYGLSLQRSQTSGRMRGRGGGPARYERLEAPGSATGAGTTPEAGFFDGLDVRLRAVFDLAGEPAPPEAAAALQRAEDRIGQALAVFSMTDPGASAPYLASARAALEAAAAATPAGTDAAFLIGVELREMDLALVAALGLEVEAIATPAGAGPTAPLEVAVPGQTLDVHTALSVGGPHPVEIVGLALRSRDGWPARGGVPTGRVEAGGIVAGTFQLPVPDDAEPSRPPFHRTSIARNVYDVRDSTAVALGESGPRAWVEATIAYGGQELVTTAPVRTLESQAPYGVARHDLTVAPALTVRTEPGAVAWVTGRGSARVSVEVVSNSRQALEAAVELELPAGWSAEPPRHTLRFAGPGESERVAFEIVAPAGGTGPGGARRVRTRVTADGRSYGEGYRRIAHRDLHPRYLYAEAAVDVVPVDVEVASGLRVGYVMGVGDEVPDAIAQLGAEVRLLEAADLAGGALDAFDAIVVGTRAYAVRPDLVAANRRLIDYAREGGNLVVLYQTPEYTPETQAPFPASLPGNAEEVSEEDAPVTILAPDHPLLTSPNAIGPADFEGWIEQRGSKFFATWAAEYTPLVETHDTGQPPQEGVWLTADVGDGHFTYASLALHRQLPYGVPGAYRILANLLSLGSTP